MVNPNRGELEVKLAEEVYQAKVTLDSIVRMEQSLGMSIVRIAQNLAAAELTTEQISTILLISLRGGGNKLDKRDVDRLVWNSGLVASMAVVGEILSAVLGGDGEGNVEAEAE